jgi:hypothetical protein
MTQIIKKNFLDEKEGGFKFETIDEGKEIITSNNLHNSLIEKLFNEKRNYLNFRPEHT